MSEIVILGSGMAGLGAAHQFHAEGVGTRLYDKNSYMGGHTATFTFDDGFIFDDGPHISFTKDERLQELFAGNVNGEYETLKAYVNNYFRGHWIKHPVQCNLHGLPKDLLLGCLGDFIAASHAEPGEIRNYRDWLIAAFGETIALTFPAVYGTKYHTVGPERMSTVWLGPRLYRPTVREVLEGALYPEPLDVHYVSHFRYPSRGGFISYLRPFAEETRMHLGHEVTGIDPKEKTVTFASGAVTHYDHLVSSIPLPELVRMIRGVPDDVRAAAAELACTTCVTVNIGVARNDFTRATWTYFYDPDVFFTRLSFPHMMSPHTCPPGCGSIQAECYYSDKYRPLDRSPDDCIEPVIRDLIRTGVIGEDDRILHRDARLIRYANIIFDLERERALPVVHGYLDDIGIVYAGRFGEWGYHWTDEAFLSGEAAARKVLARI